MELLKDYFLCTNSGDQIVIGLYEAIFFIMYFIFYFNIFFSLVSSINTEKKIMSSSYIQIKINYFYFYLHMRLVELINNSILKSL